MDLESDDIVDFFQAITKAIDSDDNEIIKSTKLLAKIGWPVLLHIDFGRLIEICNENSFDSGKLDLVLSGLFESESEDLFSSFDDYVYLLADHNVRLYRQVKGNFQQGDFEICIPALFSLIEGSLLHFTNNDRSPVKYRDKYIIELLRESKYHLYTILIYSISGLLDFYFWSSDFNKPEPSYSNRHWSQHGRFVNFKPQKKDVVKLFLFLKTIIFTKKCLDDNETMFTECNQMLIKAKEEIKGIKREG
jgi:hypothetical protein